MIYESHRVKFQGLNFRVYRDGAGLDVEGLDDDAMTDIKKMDTGKAHHLFCLLVGSSNLVKDLEKAGAEIVITENAGLFA